MARKKHRPDDILWTVTAADIDAARSEKQDITLGAVLDTRYPRKSLVKLFEEKLIHINGHKATPKDVISEGDEIWIAMAKEKIDHEPIEMELHVLYEADEDSLVLSMERSADGIHYEVNPKGKETRTDYSVLCRHQSQPVDKSVNKSKNSVDIASKNVDIELPDVDKSGQNVDKSVYNSQECGYTEVLVRLYTGKTHQIRVAFSHIGHPLVGDTLYGAQPTGQPFQLRAQKVVFTHMRTGERITVTA